MCIRDRGYEIGNSLLDANGLDIAKNVLAKAKEKGVELLLPVSYTHLTLPTSDLV